MKVLVIGASGATGRCVVSELVKLDSDVEVVAMLRNRSSVTVDWMDDPRVQVYEASILNLSDDELGSVLEECDAVVSCLGHNLSFKGVYGKPRRLVTDAVKKVYRTWGKVAPKKSLKFVLMNSSGNRNRMTNEYLALKDRMVVSLLRCLLPPHVDNEQAADLLWRNEIKYPNISWVAVRPDSLINSDGVTPYQATEAPMRSAIFDAGKVSRINVANFMSSLLLDNTLWTKWQGKMPVIYGE